ncbi:N-acetyl-1-D-myo-inositol-2-amino-2-deoxy-alpha-D-glucopyranoside deacetylase, partial [Streptomyces sp. SID8380]|nr:N-acetyl-1-D-myo-inositol-2-amino-2-deoxy-alpha-D-glucopyranoside deacetylase [Streptomyces sp. SID8380]
PFARLAAVDDVPGVVDAARVTTAVDARAHLPAKLAAMRAHATQITVAEPLFALSNDLAQPVFGVEYYELVRGEAGPPGPDGYETGLLAGLVPPSPSSSREPQS